VIAPTPSIAKRPHLVRVFSVGPTVPDGEGGFTQAPVANDPPTWNVEIRPATASDLEQVVAGTVTATATHVVSGPYRPDVKVTGSLQFEARTFNVLSVTNVDERDTELTLLCAEVIE
jgi:hypothetical protein